MTELFEKYNPKNLTEAIQALDEISENFEDKEGWLSEDEEWAIRETHHDVGRVIRNEWKLWTDDAELVQWFNKQGIYHPDDMSTIILVSFHREKNGHPWKLNEQIAFYQDYWNNYEEYIQNM